MHGPYPGELRMRVIDFVEGGGSRRGAADEFEVSVSSAIGWVQRFREDGTCEPMPRGGSTSPLEKYSRQILAFISAQRDLTLDEIVSALHKRRIPGSRSALSRFFARHGITCKKRNKKGATWGEHVGKAAHLGGFPYSLLLCWREYQAVFRRRRRTKARRPPQAAIRPGSPAPAMGPGTGREYRDAAHTGRQCWCRQRWCRRAARKHRR